AQAGGQDRPLLERVSRLAKDFQAQAAQMRQLLRRNSIARASAIILGGSHQAINNAVEALNAVRDRLNGRLDADLHRSDASAASAQQVMAGVPAGGILVSVVLALLLTGSITRPVARGVAVSEALAKGDLTARLHLAQGDEVGQLAQALDRVADTF